MAVDDSDVEIPLLTADEDTVIAEGASPEAVIASTLHSVHADMMAKLNFRLLHPHLNQAGILPVDSVPDFMRPLPPDNTSALVNNLMMWLHRCSLQQFRHFISLLRETSGEGGEAHEELAQVLEDNFLRFSSGGGTEKKSIVLKRSSASRALTFGDSSVMVMRNLAGSNRTLCNCCNRKWKDWNCKFWFFVHSLCWTVLVVSGLFPFVFLMHYPSTSAAKVSPTYSLCRNIVPVDTGSSNMGWVMRMRVDIVNCTGMVYVLHGTNCSILTEAKKPLGGIYRSWSGLTPRYFLDGSHITLTYPMNYCRDFVVLRSYTAYQEYLSLCGRLNDTDKYYGYCLNNRTLPYLCAQNSSLSPLLQNRTWCFRHKCNATFHINESDIYYLILDFSLNSVHPGIDGTEYVYDNTILQSWEDKVVYNITSSSMKIYVLLPVTKTLSFSAQDTCIVLQSDCTNDSAVSEVKYLFERRLDVLIFPSAFLVLCVFVALSIMACHVSSVHRRTQSDAETENLDRTLPDD